MMRKPREVPKARTTAQLFIKEGKTPIMRVLSVKFFTDNVGLFQVVILERQDNLQLVRILKRIEDAPAPLLFTVKVTPLLGYTFVEGDEIILATASSLKKDNVEDLDIVIHEVVKRVRK